MKKFMVNAVIAVSLGAMTLSSCIGSFCLTNNVLDWNKRATDNKFVNELIFIVISPAYAVCSVADLFVLNSIEFWTGEKVIANVGKTKDVMGKDVIHEPFAVINADDFYGKDSFEVLGKELSTMTGKKNDYCMVGYRVGNTLSESGSVARGVCQTNPEGYLTSVVERTAIERVNGKVTFNDENGKPVVIDDHTPVSMNMWGFTPDYFEHSEASFAEFLRENMDNPKAEYFIPLVVNRLITEGTARVKVLDTTSKWFGVTYAADRQGVVDKINALIKSGEYPEKLF